MIFALLESFTLIRAQWRPQRLTEVGSVLKIQKGQESSLEFFGLLWFFCFTNKTKIWGFSGFLVWLCFCAQIPDHQNKRPSSVIYAVKEMRPFLASTTLDPGETPLKCDVHRTTTVEPNGVKGGGAIEDQLRMIAVSILNTSILLVNFYYCFQTQEHNASVVCCNTHA